MSEHTEQCALIQWAAYASAEFPALRWLYSNPNGGARHITVAAKMKAEGVKAGVADLFLPVPFRNTKRNGEPGYHGLYLEMKVRGGRQSDAQKAFEAFVVEQGYRYVLAWSWPEAAAAVLDHLGATDGQRARLIGGSV